MASLQKTIRKLEDALLSLDSRGAASILAEAMAGGNGLSPMEEVLVPALERIGRSWEEGGVSLSQVYMAGRICETMVDEVLADKPMRDGPRPRMAIAVLEDHHALGKRMVKSALYSAGYRIVDYGHGLEAGQLAELALADGVDLLLISCLMFASALKVEDVVHSLRRGGSDASVVVGGAPFRLEPWLWREVGAQAMGRNSTDAVEIVNSWVEARSWK